VRHPVRHYAEFVRFGCHSYSVHDVVMSRSHANDNFLAVFLGGESPINPRSGFGGEIPYLVNRFDRIMFIHAKSFDGVHQQTVMVRMGALPDVSEFSRTGWSRVCRLPEWEIDFVTSGKNSIYAASLSQRSYASSPEFGVGRKAVNDLLPIVMNRARRFGIEYGLTLSKLLMYSCGSICRARRSLRHSR